jgi:hypothetical protein
MLIMSEKEKQKVQEEFFAKWRNVWLIYQLFKEDLLMNQF